MSILSQLKSAGTLRNVMYKNKDGSVVFEGDNGRPLPAVKDTSRESLQLAEKLDAEQSAVSDLEHWGQEMDQFFGQAQEEKKQRSGTWMDKPIFDEYRQRQDASISRLQQQANKSAEFFSANRDVYGDETVDRILSTLDRGGRRLGRAHDSLAGEQSFRGQFLNQGEFDTYQRLSTADLDELKAWNEELSGQISDINKQLRERTRHGLTGNQSSTQDRYKRLQNILDEKQQLQNRVLMRYYQMDNEEKLAKLSQDSAAQSLYQTAGLDTASKADRDSAIQALAGMGYDYNRLAQYQQTQDDAKRYKREQEEIAAETRAHYGISNAISLLVSPFQGLNYIDQAIRALTNGSPDDIETYVPLNPYNMGAVNYVSGVQGTTAEDIEKMFPNAELFGVNVPSFGYQTGSSILNSAYQVGLMGPASVISMGGAAAASEMQDIIARGGNNQQALLGGTAAGVAEMLFEKLSVENLVKPKSVTGWKPLVKETAKHAGIEASEEVFTKVANIVSDAAIMGQDSRSAQAAREYMIQGMSRDEAEKKVILDNIKDVVLAGVGGTLSGGVMGGVSGAFNLASGGGGQAQDDTRGVAQRAQDYLQDYRDNSTGWRRNLLSGWIDGQISPLEQAARDVAEREMAQEAAQEPAQAPSPQAAQNITPSARTAQEAAQGTTEAIQRAAADTSGQQRTQADTGAQQRTTQSAAQAAQAAQRTAAMKNANALVKASEVFGENGQKAFAAAWDGQQSADRYYAGFSTWYQAGLTGKAQNQVRSPYAGSISQDQQFAAYAAGQNDAAASLEREKAAAPYARTAGDEAGLVYDEYVAQAVENPQSAPPAQTAPFEKGAHFTAETAGRINTVAKALGVRVRFVDSVDGGRANAQISGSEILVERNNPNPVMTIVGHELTHRVQELSPESYRAFREAAVAELADSAVQAKLDAYRAQGENILYEQAMDEAAADYAGQLLEDGAVLDQFIERHRTDRTLLERLRDAFRALWQKLTGAERRKAQTAEGKLSAALDAAAEGADSLSKAQSPVSAYGAATPFQKGAEGPGADGETRYSLGGKEFSEDKYFARQMDRWTELGDGARVKVGMVRQGSALQQVGLPVNGMYFDTGKIKRAMSEHGDHLTAEVLKGIPDLLNDPIVITEYKGPDGKVKNTVNVYGNLFVEGKPVVVGVVMHLDHSGQNVISNIRTVHARSNFAKQITDDSVLYLNGDKKKVRSWFQVCGNLNVPLEGTKYGLIRSIAFDEGEVKRFSLKEAQLRAIQDSNPAEDDYHTWVRSVEDIKTFDEALSDPEWADYDEFDPDYTMEMARKAQKRGEITVYSSYPIQTGVFVTPSRMEAESYSGSSRVYSKTVKLDQVAWIDPTQGQFAPTSGDNSQYSLKGTTITKTYNQILRENDALRERVEYWRGQTKTTKEVTVDKKAVEKASKDIIKEYGAGIDDRDLSGRLQALYNHMARTWYANGEVENSDVWKGAEEIARDIAGGAVEEWSLDSEFPGLKEKLRDTRISVGREYDGDIQNENFRREYRGKLNLTSKEGTNVDTVYSELSEAYPGLFPADITHPADQLEQIMSVADSLYTVDEQSRFSGQMEEAVTGITNEIVEKFMELPLTKGTFADWQAMKMDKLRSENREAVQNAIAKERVAREKQVNELKKKYKARTDEGRERQKASDLRKKIDRHAKSLSGKLLHPTDKAHIPEELRGPVAKVLESINLESQYTIDPDTAHYAQRKDGKRGGLTGKHLTGDEEARGILTKRTQAFLELKQKYADINENGGDLVIDPTLLGSDEGSIDAVIAMGDTRIVDMNSQQLNTVWQVLKSVEHSVSTAGKMLNQAKYERTSQWADALKQDTATRRNKRTLTERHMTLDLENPYTFFSHFGQAGKDMYRTLRDAQDRQQVLTNQVADAVEKAIAGDAKNAAKVIEKTVKELEKKTGDFTTEGGQKLTLSTSQVMELYELSKREQALEHLLIGGIVQPEIRGTKVRRGTEAIHLTTNDLANITGTLTAEEKRIADGLQKIASTLLSDMGNEASMTAYGYKKFTEPNYWPIRSAREALHSNIEKGGDNTRSIKNIGMAQATKPHANNQVDIGSIFDTFARHTGDMVDYAAWLVPMEDLNRVYNYQYRDGEGNPTGKTVKGLLDDKGGAGSQKYWHNLMEDIQNGIKAKSDSPFVDTFSKGVGKFKSSAVVGNVRVIVQQPTALFRAAAVMNPADMAAGLVKGATKGFGWQKALKYSPIAMRKDAGGFDISSPGTMKETLFGKTGVVNKINDLAGKLPGAADAWTWGKLWNASEWQVARQNKDLQKGSHEFYEEVNRVFTDMIDQTQVVDGILQRANIMRTSNAMGQQATSFMGEPIMSLNLTMRAWDQLRNEQDHKKRGKAMKTLARSVTALTVTAAVNALAQSLVDGLRDDDKDKKYSERFWSAFHGQEGDEGSNWEKALSFVLNGNMGQGLNPANQIPYIKDVMSILQGYDVSRAEFSVIEDIVEAGQSFIKNADGTGPRTMPYSLNKLFASAAKMYGLPVSNVERDVWSIARSIAIETGNLPLQYEMEKAIYNIGSEKNKSRFSDIMYRALEAGEMDTYLTIREDMMRLTPKVDGTSLDSTMKSRYKSHLEKDPSYTLPQRSLDLLGIRTKLDNTEKEDSFGADDLDNEAYNTYAGKRADSWRAMSNNIAGSKLYKQLSNAEKDKAMDYAWEYAHQTALAEASGGKYKPSSEWIADAQEAQKNGVEPWEFALDKAAYSTDTAYKALESGDLEEYRALRGKYMDILGKEGTSVDAAMRRDYEDKLEENPNYALNQAAMDLIGIHPSGSSDSGDSFGADDLGRAAYDAYTIQRSEVYRETVDGLKDLPSYKDMDQATRDKLVSMAYAMAHQTALADNSDGRYSPTYTWVNDALDAQENAGIENGEFILWRTAYNSAFSDKDANNKPIKGREKKDKVKAWLLSQEDLTPAQRAYLWGTEYKSAW